MTEPSNSAQGKKARSLRQTTFTRIVNVPYSYYVKDFCRHILNSVFLCQRQWARKREKKKPRSLKFTAEVLRMLTDVWKL
jgi:hypothetical protein